MISPIISVRPRRTAKSKSEDDTVKTLVASPSSWRAARSEPTLNMNPRSFMLLAAMANLTRDQRHCALSLAYMAWNQLQDCFFSSPIWTLKLSASGVKVLLALDSLTSSPRNLQTSASHVSNVIGDTLDLTLSAKAPMSSMVNSSLTSSPYTRKFSSSLSVWSSSSLSGCWMEYRNCSALSLG